MELWLLLFAKQLASSVGPVPRNSKQGPSTRASKQAPNLFLQAGSSKQRI